MNRILLIIWILILNFFLAAQSFSADIRDNIACGPYVTQKILMYYSKNYDITKIRTAFGILDQAVSLLDIKRVLLQLDLPAEAARLEGINQLPHWIPCIAHMKNNHFTVIVDAGQEELLLDDDRDGLHTVSTKRFLEEWNGVILSPRLTGPESANPTTPLIHHPISVNLGQVRIHTVIPVSIDLINTTEKEIAITDVKSTCGCLHVSLSRETVTPKDSIQIHAKMNTGMLPGLRSEAIILHHDQDKAPYVIPITLQSVKPAVVQVLNSSLDLGTLFTGEIRNATISLSKLFDVDLDSIYTFCSPGIITQATRIVQSGDDGPTIDFGIQVNPNKPRGALNEQFQVFDQKGLLGRADFVGLIKPKIEVNPATVFFKSEELIRNQTKNVILTSHLENQTFQQIIYTDMPSGFHFREKIEGKKAILFITPHPSLQRADSQTKSLLKFKCQLQGETVNLDIPIFCQ